MGINIDTWKYFLKSLLIAPYLSMFASATPMGEAVWSYFPGFNQHILDVLCISFAGFIRKNQW